MYHEILPTIDYINRVDPEVAAPMQRELHRQQHNIELIASENFVSRRYGGHGLGVNQ